MEPESGEEGLGEAALNESQRGAKTAKNRVESR